MLPTIVAKSNRTLLDAAVNCAWRQWSVVGGGALESIRPTEALVDPEALVLASLALTAHEPRLGEAATNWCVTNNGLLSVGRLAALCDRFDTDDVQGLAALARVVRYDAKDHRWSALMGSPVDTVAKPIAQSRRANSPAATPRWAHEQTLMLRLRLGLGLGAKADLLTIFLAKPRAWMDISELVDLSGYARSPVQRAAEDLAAAGFVRRRDERPAAFFMERSDLWTEILYPTPAHRNIALRWQRWSDAYGFVSRWQAFVHRIPIEQPGEFALAVEASKLITVRPGLWHDLNVDLTRVATTSMSWEPLAHAFTILQRAFEGTS
ncbi:MAG TPA: hypothetical protein VIJ16_11410 [Gemmatimonadaceae bacterium]